MALQLLLGSSGTGKTTYIYEQMIKKSRENSTRPVIFMLPEQANMSAEREMISVHPMSGTMDISILSFTRLAFKVFDERNVHTQDVLDDFGKSMFVMKLMKEHEKELCYYQSMIGKQGFVEEVKSILSEFYQYQITEEILDQTIEKLNPDKSLYHKLSDVKVLFHAFQEAIADSYMVAEQYLSLLKEVLSESEFLRDAEIYFDGFTGFTPAQYSVIEELLKLGCNVYVAVTMDANLFGNNEYNSQGLFAMSKDMCERLCKLAESANVPVLPHVSFEENYRMQSKNGLKHLERQLFRFPIIPSDCDEEDVIFLKSDNIKTEADTIARIIHEKVKNEQLSYNDFAIVIGNVGGEKEIWKQVMERYNIPYFLDFNEHMTNNPLAEMIRQIKFLVQTDFGYESVFALLKMGFIDIEWNEIYTLEHYVKKHGVRGYSWWKSPFRGNQKGLGIINATREKWMNSLESLQVLFESNEGKAKDYILAIHSFMSTNNIPFQLHEKSILFEQNGDLRQGKAYGQVYDKFLTVIDKMMDILGEDFISRDTFLEMLQTGIGDMKLGVIPSTLDQVMIGDIERSRIDQVKYLFVAGLNEGMIPHNVDSKGILGDRDRESLKEMNVCLAPNSREEMYLQQFYFYMQITKPSEGVYLCWREEESTGEAIRPSYYLSRIEAIFPKNSFRNASDIVSNYPSTKEALMDQFALQLSQLDEHVEEDASYLQIMRQLFPKEYQNMLDGYLYNNENTALKRQMARRLYGERMIHSVSRLETYSGCAYQFFLQYGLKLRKPEEYSIETNNIGTILHAVMEHFFTWVRDEKIVLEERDMQDIFQKVDILTEEAAKEENETIFESSYRNRHMLNVLKRIARRSVENLCRHLTQGEMKPTYFEERFSPESKLDYIQMALKDGVQMDMQGIVDRVDIKETEDTVYYKIIDYKSGAKDIDFIKMFEGRQLQLTVYMSVIGELLKQQYPNKKIVPTGMYYYHIQDLFVEETEEDKIEKKRVQESRLTGLVNQDEVCLELMDHRTGDVVPVKYNKDSSFSANNKSLVTQEDLDKISKFVREKMIEIGNDIVDGKISMNPEKGEHSSPCNLCDYRSICRFEPGLGGNRYKIAPQMTKEEAKRAVLGKEAADEVDE